MKLRVKLRRNNLNENKGSKREKVLIEEKRIFDWKRICKLNFIFLFINFMILVIGIYLKKQIPKGVIDTFNENNKDFFDNIQNVIIALSTISVSIFQIVIQNINDRIMGISYKRIFFNDLIWKYFNFSTCIFILAEVVVISIFNCNIKICDEPIYQLMRYVIQIELLLIAIGFSYTIFYLTLIAVFKKSIIYKKMKKKIINNEANTIIDKISENLHLIKREGIEGKRVYNSYLYEEIGIFAYIIMNLKEEVYEDRISKKDIIEAMRAIINSDNRNSEKIFENIKIRGNEEFKDEKEIWNKIYEEIERKTLIV